MKLKETVNWDSVNKKYENFTDLGNYVIKIDEITSNDIDKALRYVDSMYDGWDLGCTCCAKLNSNSEVILGRNLDMMINQTPTIISYTSYGKYQTVNFASGPAISDTYKEILEKGKLDEEFLKAIPYLSSDCFNSEGLYIECNMRPANIELTNSGTNPGKKRASLHALPALVATNCKTVKEAVRFIQNEYDFYTTNCENAVISHCNFAYMIGDATGEYGLVEIVKNKVIYMPYQMGHANYYVSPMANEIQKIGWGYGRLQAMYDVITAIDTEEEFQKAMEKAMWKNGILYVNDAYRDEKGNIHFEDHDGNPIMDWRTEYEQYFPVDKEGNLVEVTGHEEGYGAFFEAMSAGDVEGMRRNEPELNAYNEFLDRCDGNWVLDNGNFELLKETVKGYLDSTDAEYYLKEFYSGNDQPIRDNGTQWISTFNIGVNCAKKHLTLKIWENDDTVVDFQW